MKSVTATLDMKEPDTSKLREILNQTAQWAQDELQKRGHRLRSKVSFEIDPKLDIMGCTEKDASGQKIIVSSGAISGPMLKCLLVHELSHAILTDEKHPSHQSELLSVIVRDYSGARNLDDKIAYVLREALNYIQDIYADDVGFEISVAALGAETMRSFYERWVTEGASVSGGPNKKETLVTCVSNAFARANLGRHGLLNGDALLEIRRKNTAFLKSAFSAQGFEEAVKLHVKLVNYLETLGDYGETQKAAFTEEMERYFGLILALAGAG